MNSLKYIPMDGSEMMEYNPDARLMRYSDLYNFDNIDDVFGHHNKIVLLYLMDTPNSGHWTGLKKDGDTIMFFDSYGFKIDEEQKYPLDKIKIITGQTYPYLSDLLKNSNYNVIRSPYKLQGKGTQTCGRYVSLFLMNDLNPNEFYNKYFRGVKNPDDLIIKYIK